MSEQQDNLFKWDVDFSHKATLLNFNHKVMSPFCVNMYRYAHAVGVELLLVHKPQIIDQVMYVQIFNIQA